MKALLKINLILSISLLALVFLSSCTYEDLGLPVSNSDTEEVLEAEAGIGGQLSEEELFLEMKAKQDKNPLNDIDVRKAILHAVDRERIVEEIFEGYNNVSNSLFTEGSPFWDPVWGEYDYDLEKAGEILTKAGFGTDNPLYITIRAVNNSDSKQLIEDIIKQDLDKIGIKLWIYNDSPKEFYQNHVYNGNFDLGLWSLYVSGVEEIEYSFSSNKIPPMETEENTSCENFYWYSNSRADDLLRQLAAINDVEIIKDKTREIQEILAGDAVILPLYSRLFTFAHDDNIKSVDLETLEDRIFYNIEDWTLPSGRETAEGEIPEVIIGYESDSIDVFNGFEPYFINDLLFRGLWKKNNDGTYSPEMAEEPEGTEVDISKMISNEFNVRLRDDIYWNDGEPITSEDVKYTFEYFRNFMEEKKYFSNLDEDYEKIEDINIIDEKNFTIVFKEHVEEWKKFFPQVFKKDQFGQGDYNSLIYSRIASNGPYKVVMYDNGGEMVLEINEYYYNKIPEIERLRIRFDPDIHNLITMLREGEVNFLGIPVDPELMRILEDEDGMKIVIEAGNLVEHLALSLKPVEE